MAANEPYVMTMEAGTSVQGLFAFRLVDALPVLQGREDSSLLRNVDFINALYGREPERALALRYLVRPVNGTIDAGWVEVVLLGRVSAVDLKEAERQARRFADELSAILAGFAPELRWDVIEDRERLAALLQPLDWRQAHLAEIRRREEHLDMQTGRQRPSFAASHGERSEGW